MIGISTPGSFKKTNSYLSRLLNPDLYQVLDRYGRMGVDALARNTPVRTGATARSWDYKIERTRTRTTISWHNTNKNDGANIAILIQYGHGTGTGGFVSGYDYIKPAIRPIFDQIAEDIWRTFTAA